MNLDELLPEVGRKIPFAPELARWLGDKKTPIFLSQLIYWADKGEDPDGWIYKTHIEMEKETTLSRTDQDKARKKLTELGVLEVGRKKIHGIRHFRINQRVLTQKWKEYLSSQNEQASPYRSATATSCLQKSDKDDCKNSTEMSADNPQTHVHKSTSTSRQTENTTELIKSPRGSTEKIVDPVELADLSDPDPDSLIPVNPNSKQLKFTTEIGFDTIRGREKDSEAESQLDSCKSSDEIKSSSSAVHSNTPWKLGQSLPKDDQGFVVLPRNPQDVQHNWQCVVSAKKTAIRQTQRYIVAAVDDSENAFGFEYEARETDEEWEYALAENGERIVIDSNSFRSGIESDMFAKDGPLPLKKLRDVAIHLGDVSTDEFNKVLEEEFCLALKELLEVKPAKR